MAEQTSIAVLGTGIMGGAMAGRLADAGFDVRVWNRDRAKAEALADRGATVAGSPSEAVAGADVVLTMLSDGPVTEAVMSGAVGSAAEGALWLQMATVGAAATARLGELAAAAGMAFVDAPVLGTKDPAEQGRLLVFASGPEQLAPRCKPVFDAVAREVSWLGDVGAGSRMKLVVNAWLASLLAGVAEAIALAEGTGVDPADFLAVIDDGPIGCAYAQQKGAMMLERSYPTSFPLHLLAKDVGLVAAAARDAGRPLRLPSAIAELLADATGDHGDDDMSAVVEALRPTRATPAP